MHAISYVAIAGMLAASCTDSPDNQIEFHGEQAVLPGFAKDTGLQPASSPVQLQLMFSAGGSLTADAQAIAGGSGETMQVAAVPGSGRFKLDAHIKLDGKLHVDASGQKYDGPIPGIENIDIAFGGEAMFDPFLIGGMAHVSASLPEVELPPIPLPGGLPGTLRITIATGSVLTSDLRGSCASMEGSSVKYSATTTTSGTLVLKSKIVMKLGPLEKSFDIPTFSIDLPALEAAMDLGTHAFAGGGAAPSGASLATKGACGAGGGGGGGNGGGGGAGAACTTEMTCADGLSCVDGKCEPAAATCSPALEGYTPVWHPPNGTHANQCGGNQLTEFKTACLDAGLGSTTCAAFRTGNLNCFSCLVTPATSPGYGPIVRYPGVGLLNVEGCAAIVAPTLLSCAKSVQAYNACVAGACSSCEGKSTTERNACFSDAAATVCAAYLGPANTCVNQIANHPAGSNCFNTDTMTRLFCGP